MSSSTASTITEPPPTARRNTTPTFELLEDLEAQQPEKQQWATRRRPSGVTRAYTNTSPSSSTIELKSIPKRRDTLLSTESSFSSPASERPPLERKPTYRVEDEALHGYPKLAQFLGGHEGYAIYKRFAALNARNLLYHQAKLTRLEHELNNLEQLFQHESDLHYKVDHIFSEDNRADTAACQLRTKYEQVSRALKEYNTLLLEQKQLHALPSPDPTFVDSIYSFIYSEKGPKPDWLQHPENTVYAVWEDNREPIQKDLVTLNQEFKQQDPFTKFFISSFIDWWHTIYSRFAVRTHTSVRCAKDTAILTSTQKADTDFDEYIYSEKAISRYMNAVVMVVASGLPTCSIVALYYIHSMLWRLVFIILFGGVFACALAIFTDARRVDVFLASVAMASVQVVFVGTSIGNSNGGGVG